ncbi:sirohydrochlorin chelatase [Salinicoccus albus]|uniref:sirohydrochlorin chelatase n=1 Tax=Salinicoccus albus TaxID=418756 RepID=UPI00037FD735|nr:sirohydrochlorin chelatase [Salinicoccus albus]
MKGVLYISHGSRIETARREAVEFINSVKQVVNIDHQEMCFLELAEPDVTRGVEILLDQGVTEISVVPVLLLSAGHYYNDIPKELDAINEKYPHIEFSYGKPLGVQHRITNILNERINETNVQPNSDAKLLLVGRGSYNPQTQADITSIGDVLRQTTGFNHVRECYLAACHPSFEDTLGDSLEAGHSQIFIVPYLWFTGVLERHMESTVKDRNTRDSIILCHHLGNHPAMRQALKERVYETFELLPQ